MSNLFTAEADFARVDWRLLQNSAVSLFRSQTLFVEMQDVLSQLDYKVTRVTCRHGEAVFREQMSVGLHWHRFGYAEWNGNLNALGDALYDYPFGPSGRAALALEGFQDLVRSDSETAHVLLDDLERVSRNHLLSGNLLIALVQTDNPDFNPGTLGGRQAWWNPAEWLRTAR